MKLVPAVIERAKDGTLLLLSEPKTEPIRYIAKMNASPAWATRSKPQKRICKNKEAIHTRAGCFGLRGGS